MAESIPILTHEKNLLFFYEEAAANEGATVKAGRAMFDKVLRVRITVPGDKSEMIYEVEREYPEGFAHPIHGKIKKGEVAYKRFGRYIEDFKAKGAGPGVVSGTPIDHWPLVDTRRVAMLKHNGVYSVEALASLSDAGIQVLGMGGRELVQKAKDWLATAANSALAMETAEKNRALEAKMDNMQDQITQLADALAELPPEAQAQVKASLAKRGKKAA